MQPIRLPTLKATRRHFIRLTSSALALWMIPIALTARPARASGVDDDVASRILLYFGGRVDGAQLEDAVANLRDRGVFDALAWSVAPAGHNLQARFDEVCVLLVLAHTNFIDHLDGGPPLELM